MIMPLADDRFKVIEEDVVLVGVANMPPRTQAPPEQDQTAHDDQPPTVDDQDFSD